MAATNQQQPADHETASPESGDRAQPTNTGAKTVRHGSASEPEFVNAASPADHETASPESGDRAQPTP
jgi:hypothetical protein